MSKPNSKARDNRVKDTIRDSKMTYAAIAAELGITPQAISEIVHGRTTSSTARYSVAAVVALSPAQRQKVLRKLDELWPDHRS